MMLLPTGHVMFAAGSAAIYVYEPAGGPDPAWAPHITAAPSTIRPSHSYTLHGRQLNGRSQAVGYGDDAAAATNYPLVRLHNRATGRVVYCRTFDHSTMGVATGSAVETTNFAVPAGVPHGRWDSAGRRQRDRFASVTVTVGATRTPVSLDADTWGLVRRQPRRAAVAGAGPNGPVPVDAWGASMARRAAGARADVLAGLRTLMVLGEDAAGRRASEAEQRPPAVDADAVQSADRPAEALAGKSARGAAKGRTRKARTPAPALV